MQFTLPSVLGTLALALAATLGAAPQTAQAAYVVVNADPLLGSNYPGIGWSAQGALYIPDTCYTSLVPISGFYQLNLQTQCNTPRGGIAQLQDVQVKLYNGLPSNVFDTIAFDNFVARSVTSGPTAAFSTLLDIEFFDGQVVGFHTTLSGFTSPHSPLGDDSSTALQLRLAEEYAGPSEYPAAACGTDSSSMGSFLCVTGVRNESTTTGTSNLAQVSNGVVLTDDQYAALTVPEAGSLPLVVAGLAGAWWARRRRSPTA